MPAYTLRSARRRRQVAAPGCSRPTTPARRAPSCARRRWCRSTCTPVATAAREAAAGAALRAPRLQLHRPRGLDAPARRPGRLRPAAGARADRARRRGRGPAPARAGGPPARRGQRRHRRSRARWPARRASSTTSTARVVAAGEQSGALGAVLERLADDLEERQALRAKLIGADAVPGDRLAGRGGDRRLPRHLRRAAGRLGVRQHASARCPC